MSFPIEDLSGGKGQMLFFALFLAGFMLGVFVALYVFKPEKQEEAWDSQHFPAKYGTKQSVFKPNFRPRIYPPVDSLSA